MTDQNNNMTTTKIFYTSQPLPLKICMRDNLEAFVLIISLLRLGSSPWGELKPIPVLSGASIAWLCFPSPHVLITPMTEDNPQAQCVCVCVCVQCSCYVDLALVYDQHRAEWTITSNLLQTQSLVEMCWCSGTKTVTNIIMPHKASIC